MSLQVYECFQIIQIHILVTNKWIVSLNSDKFVESACSIHIALFIHLSS